MQWLAAFAMRGHVSAVLVISVCAMLALRFPPLAYLGIATVALVALRRGLGSTLVIMALSGAAIGVLSLLAFQRAEISTSLVIMALVSWLPVLLMAQMLRETRSLSLAFETAVAIAGTAILLTYAVIGDPTSLWQDGLDRVLPQVLSSAGLSGDQFDADMVHRYAVLMTRIMASSVIVSMIGCLLLGRWWQSRLYNPGGFQTEFHALRFSIRTAMLGVMLLAGSLVLSGTAGQLSSDLSMPVLSIFVFQGLAVAHAIVQRAGAHVAWLIAMYVLTAVAMPQMALMLGLVGLLDVVMDFRARWASRQM